MPHPDDHPANPYAELDAEADLLQKAVADVCNDHPMRVVIAVLSVLLEWGVVVGTTDEEGLHAFLDIFGKELHRLWALKEAGQLHEETVN